MRKILSVITLSTAFSVLALAESWSGRLIDASCYTKQQSTKGCDATAMTTSFALDVSGKVYNLDATGNQKAVAALKNRADQADPAKSQSKAVMAKVEGTESAGVITLTDIEIQ